MNTETSETPVKGALIYQPQGAAGEYAKWAINLYNGCSNGCTYCYNRRGVLSYTFEGEPTPKAILINKTGGIVDKLILAHVKDENPEKGDLPKDLFQKVLENVIFDLINKDMEKIGQSRLIEDGGVFMSFTCDPLATEENVQHSTFVATVSLLRESIPVTLLTKNVEWLEDENWKKCLECYPRYYADDNYLASLTIGFTITGKDKLEPNAPSTEKRIEALCKLHDEYKIKTFVSLEPITSLAAASEVIKNTYQITDEIRIGVQSPIKKDRYDAMEFIGFVLAIKSLADTLDCRFMVKDSMYKQAETFEDAYRYMCIEALDEIREIYAVKSKEENHEK